ncbi:MAG: adenosylcobinamide-phosphate synthase, partial [Alphaproteobacteria bacterium]|nr:adenosylcobinamide-phosphate synthase [Alphaproteobacteria bacterium]
MMNAFPDFFQTDILVPERFSMAVLAMVLCAVVGMITGPMHGNAHPFYWKFINGTVGALGKRLDRTQRKPADLMMRGFLLLVGALILSYLVGQCASQIVARWPFWGITQIILLSLTLTSGTVWFSLLRVYGALEKDAKVSPGAYA